MSGNDQDGSELIFNKKVKNEMSIPVLLKSQNLQNVLKSILDPKTEIVTSTVRKASNSSASVYLPKAHIGKKATIIIWSEE